MSHPRWLFVTGRLAAEALHEQLRNIPQLTDEVYSVAVLPISVAGLMTPEWVAKHLQTPSGTTHVMLPGYCRGPLESLQATTTAEIVRGPRDLRELSTYFGDAAESAIGFGQFDIEIIAEINHAPDIPFASLRSRAERLRDDGADIVDIGCNPYQTWKDVGHCVKLLREAGHRVSIDSFNVAEIADATRSGAELVLSVNSTNRDAAKDWGCPVVVVPDDVSSLEGLDASIEQLQRDSVPFLIDPILEPIGCGFAASLQRYMEVRRRYPDAQMMMGIGNVTELTDCDSAGMNVILLAICQELGIRSVLTTEVINWCRSSVRECDVARRLAYHAVTRNVLPKHLTPDLVMLRDPRRIDIDPGDLQNLSRSIRDNNFRVFVADNAVHIVGRQLHLSDADPFQLFNQLYQQRAEHVDASHAFYLGYEMAKAAIAITLGKNYRQDEALAWGLLTEDENRHRLPRTPRLGAHRTDSTGPDRNNHADTNRADDPNDGDQS
ncbi:MAG: DUF6513 domain-containing protein [Pirellulaceae bacterium]